MPAYDANRFDPPAPVAYVTLRHPTTGAIVSDVPLLMDTGADVTLLPQEFVEQLGILPDEGKVYELEGFGGDVKLANVVKLELLFLGRKFKGQFLLLDQPIGIMGRNVLNTIALVLDGPRGEWSEQKR
ncbi:MAG: retropepsin-like domain-containing protein [Chloroflexi bacterium]|nr:retropepsin-like domain-containing protein [Chloroflexota bacterium]